MIIDMSINHVDAYLKPDQMEDLDKFLRKTPFFYWCLTYPNELSQALIEMLAKIINQIGYEADGYEKALVEKLSESSQQAYMKAKEHNGKADIKYVVLAQVGYSLDEKENEESSPIQYARELQQELRMKRRGFFYDDKGKLTIEPNTFASYFSTRMDLVQTTEGDIFRYEDGMRHHINKNVLKTLARNVVNEIKKTTWKSRFEREYMLALEHEIPFIEGFDTDPDIINFKNGLLNIKTLEFTEHRPGYHSINQLPYEYDPEAKCPRFEQFLDEIFEGDGERVKLMQQILGYIWLKDIKIHKLFIFLGNGSNGKSVLAKIMYLLYGVLNVSSTPLSALERRFGLQELPGKLVNISSENEYSKELNTENLKLVTSGDAISIEKKYHDAFTTSLIVKLILLLNKLMDTSDTSDGYMRRLTIIPFNVRFEERVQGEEERPGVHYMNPNLVEELQEELPGIFNFSMEGLQDLIVNDFQMVSSRVCEQALEDYKRHQNPVVDFVEECMEYEEGAELILRSSITKVYKKWFKEQGEGAYCSLTDHKILANFRQEIGRLGWNTAQPKINGHYYLKDMRFKSSTLLEASDEEGYVSPME